MNVKVKKVFVGLSGGVDSAVTAALLQAEGAEVTGVFIKGWYPPELPCTWAEDRRDAMRVAAKLHIPFVTLDASVEYKKSVIDYLVREYAVGRTPNPDIFCNRDVKFGAFYTFAKKHGADFVATGHYARVVDGALLRGIDTAKDQSYFLWAISKETLPSLLFPLGNLHKTDVRALAARYALPVAQKRDSQGICFLGAVSIEDFLRSEIGLTRGNAYDETGSEMGTHEGAISYTLGERANIQGAPPGPWYVMKKDIQKNTLMVANTPFRSGKIHNSIRFSNLHWFTSTEGAVSAQTRYHGPLVEGILDTSSHTFTPIKPLSEQCAPGQSVVFYRGETLVGGAVIEE